MSEKRTDERAQAGGEGASPADLATLARQLREKAATVPLHLRADAVSAAETVHAHAISERPDAQQMTPHLRRLEAYAELAPTVNAIMQALSNVGF